jgi:hypothetical protein
VSTLCIRMGDSASAGANLVLIACGWGFVQDRFLSSSPARFLKLGSGLQQLGQDALAVSRIDFFRRYPDLRELQQLEDHP